MIFQSAMQIPFCLYFLCVICVTYNHKITIPLWDHVGACSSWRDKMVKMVKTLVEGTYLGHYSKLREFSKNHKKINCGDPKFLFSFVIKGQLFLQLGVIFVVFWRWRTRLRTCDLRKCMNLEKFDLWPQLFICAPTRSHQLNTWNCFRPFRSFIWARLLDGILLAHWVMANWKWREGAVSPCFGSV